MERKRLFLLIFILSFSLGYSQSEKDSANGINEESKPIPFPLISFTPKSKKCASFKFKFKYNYEYHECFNKEVVSFIQKNLSKEFIRKNWSELKNAGDRLMISFIIDKEGGIYNMKIKSRGLPIESKEFYEKLENEFSKMFEAFKKISPGKHLGKIVEVFYSSTLDLKIK